MPPGFASPETVDTPLTTDRSVPAYLATLHLLRQQIAIVNAIKRRFESSLFEIKQLVQADVFDDELDSVRGLLKNGYTRAAGAVAGVVLEGHLKELAAKHNLPNSKNHQSD
ncbi:hypothetical protein [Pseudomonas vranovensis]|uniref:Uncharacterized protein n=1 Tax=Pseudomonas vranovensis TaxID=321661 RepID=A0A423D4Y9_9PSED|nr:hypothetical protein [Pseudomonas vranovensis]ROL66619.1 hypothetical protein BHU25_20790 [Pseudomonas vranovensis]